ncbi:MAG TPA: tripartite tricarboxylate transporter substrate binding protein, partial [Ramlibacter sp.]|nr:tripartite tricarboxylate transporter substrate binding protein [Ramlibacter sp.]
MKRRQFMAAGTAAALSTLGVPAWAQAAGGLLNIILPYPPGGSADTTIRLIADEIGRELKRS